MPSSPLAALEEAERRLGRLSVTPERVEGGAIRCSGCGERVTGRYMVAPNKKAFHPECLRCELCGESFINAVIVPCGHGACEPCLKRWQEETQVGATMPCPTCR